MIKDETLAGHVRMMRDMRGLSVEVVARRTGIAAARLYAIERGSGAVTLPELRDIAAALDTTAGTLVDGPVRGRVIETHGLNDDVTTAIEVIVKNLTNPGTAISNTR